MVVVGDTDRLALAAVVDPIDVVKPASVYQTHVAPVPRVPPVCVNVAVWLPVLHNVEFDVFNTVGATEGWFTVIVTSPVGELVQL